MNTQLWSAFIVHVGFAAIDEINGLYINQNNLLSFLLKNKHIYC